MRTHLCAALLLVAGVVAAADSVQVIALTPTANEQNLVPASVLFTRDGSGVPLTVYYRITGSARSSQHGGSVAQVKLLTSGDGYLDPAQPLVFSGGAPVSPPTATADGQGGYVDTVTMTAGGSGYTSPPNITIHGGGSGATASATLSGYVTGVTVSAGGSGYNPGDPVQLTGGGGSGATAVVASTGVGGSITGITVTGGTNYTSAPTVGFSGGAGAAGAATIDFLVDQIEVQSGGQGYASATVSIDDGGGSGASATANLLGSPVDGVTLGSSGYGYALPVVTLSGNAVARPVITDGMITGLAIENAGSGYGAPPSVTISAPSAGIQAAATATIDANGRVNGFIITNQGTGYGPTATAASPGPDATFAVVLAGADYTAPAGSSIESATGDLVGSITFASNEVAKSLALVPLRNGVGGARAAVVQIDASAIGDYITNQNSSASVSIADADVQATLSVPRPIAYPTPPSLPSATLPLEVQGRGEWLIQLNDATLFRSVAVELAGDSAVGPSALLGSEYWLGYNSKTIEATASDYVTVVPLNPSTSPQPSPPGPGATTIPVSSAWPVDSIVMFENPTDALNGIYTVTATSGRTATNNPTITITPALKRIQTSYGTTRVRLLATRMFPSTTGSGDGNRYTIYGAISNLRYFAFPVSPEAKLQARRSVNLTLLQSDDYRTLSPTSGTVTLADDTLTVGVRLLSNAAKPSTNGVFEVVFTNPFPSAVSVPYAVLSGTSAVLGSDYTISGIDAATGLGSILVPSGASVAQIVVQPLSNADLSTESMTLQLLSSPDYLLAPSGNSAVNPSASMSIAPAPRTTLNVPVYLAISSVTVAEGAGTATLTIRLSDAAGVPLVGDSLAAGAAVGFTGTGSATAVSDYTAPASNSLAMAAGSSSVTIVLPIVDDRLVENDETISINLQPGAGYQLSAIATGTVTIQDNEPSMTVSAPATGPVEAGAAVSFTITSSRAVEVATTVGLSLGGTATSGTDYADLPVSVTIPIGQSSTTVAVAASADLVSDPGETVVLTLLDDVASPATYKLGATTAATLTISEPPVTTVAIVSLLATDASATQGATADTGTIRVSANRVGSAVNTAVTVTVLVGGTAVPGTSYTALPSNVVLAELITTVATPAGAGFLTAQVVGGGTADLPAGCVLRLGSGATTVTVSTAVTVDETGVVIPLSAPLAAIVPIGTSIGVCTGVLTVTPISSAVNFSGQTVVATASATSGANWAAAAAPADTATVTIGSAYPLITIAAGSTAPVEGGAAGAFTLISNQIVAVATTVTYAVSGTATSGTDFTALTGTATIPVGSNTVSVPLAALADAVADPGETVILTLQADPAATTTYHVGATTTATLTISETATSGTTPKTDTGSGAGAGGGCGAGGATALLLAGLALLGLRRRRAYA